MRFTTFIAGYNTAEQPVDGLPHGPVRADA